MRYLTIGALVLASALEVGCFGGPPSHLAKGEAYTSGKEKYDTFFASVKELRSKADEAEGEAPIRKKVAVAVGLQEDAKLEDTIDAAKSRSNELKKDGGRFFVVVAPEPKLILKKGAEENKDAATFAQTIEDAIKQGIQRGDELDGLAREAASLEQTQATLDKDVEVAFKDSEEKEQVKVELVAAKDILERSRLRAGNESGRALRFVVLLASAVDSGAAAELLAMTAGATAKQTKVAKIRPGGGRGGSGKPAKPKPKNDFNP